MFMQLLSFLLLFFCVHDRLVFAVYPLWRVRGGTIDDLLWVLQARLAPGPRPFSAVRKASGGRTRNFVPPYCNLVPYGVCAKSTLQFLAPNVGPDVGCLNF